MSRLITAGASARSIYFDILDSTSVTGARKTGLAWNTSGLIAYYARNQGAATQITLATLASPSAAYSSGGFVEVASTTMPGIYRLDIPDAVIAAGVQSAVVVLSGATGMVQASEEIQLTVFDLQATPGAILEAGTLQTATGTTAQLRAGASSVDNDPTLVGMVLYIEAGTGAGQGSRIASYVGTTKIATVDGWRSTIPDSTSKYIVL